MNRRCQATANMVRSWSTALLMVAIGRMLEKDLPPCLVLGSLWVLAILGLAACGPDGFQPTVDSTAQEERPVPVGQYLMTGMRIDGVRTSGPQACYEYLDPAGRPLQARMPNGNARVVLFGVQCPAISNGQPTWATAKSAAFLAASGRNPDRYAIWANDLNQWCLGTLVDGTVVVNRCVPLSSR